MTEPLYIVQPPACAALPMLFRSQGEAVMAIGAIAKQWGHGRMVAKATHEDRVELYLTHKPNHPWTIYPVPEIIQTRRRLDATCGLLAWAQANPSTPQPLQWATVPFWEPDLAFFLADYGLHDPKKGEWGYPPTGCPGDVPLPPITLPWTMKDRDNNRVDGRYIRLPIATMTFFRGLRGVNVSTLREPNFVPGFSPTHRKEPIQ